MINLAFGIWVWLWLSLFQVGESHHAKRPCCQVDLMMRHPCLRGMLGSCRWKTPLDLSEPSDCTLAEMTTSKWRGQWRQPFQPDDTSVELHPDDIWTASKRPLAVHCRTDEVLPDETHRDTPKSETVEMILPHRRSTFLQELLIYIWSVVCFQYGKLEALYHILDGAHPACHGDEDTVIFNRWTSHTLQMDNASDWQPKQDTATEQWTELSWLIYVWIFFDLTE
jgi:hypothetical protein